VSCIYCIFSQFQKFSFSKSYIRLNTEAWYWQAPILCTSFYFSLTIIVAIVLEVNKYVLWKHYLNIHTCM
jgi:hypothetical protein